MPYKEHTATELFAECWNAFRDLERFAALWGPEDLVMIKDFPKLQALMDELGERIFCVPLKER